jgi:tetratricopeptide (TPR) repeat protein
MQGFLIFPDGIDLFSTVIWGVVITAIGGLMVEMLRGSFGSLKTFLYSAILLFLGTVIWLSYYNLPVYSLIALGTSHKNCADGIDYWSRATKLGPKLGLPYALLGECYHRYGNHALAIQWLEAGKAYEPRARILTELGWTYNDSQQYPLAEQNFRESLQIMPESASAEFGLGYALHHEIKYEDSLIELTRAVELAPENMHARFWLAWSLLENQQCANAFSEFQYVISNLGFESAPYIVSRSHAGSGFSQLCLQNYGLARNEFQTSLEQDSTQDDVLNALESIK